MSKKVKKLNDVEIFEHKVGDRVVTVAFKLDGDKITEVVHTIQDPMDSVDSQLAENILIERLKKQRKNGHYEEMDDVDILDYAAKGLAEEKVQALELRLEKQEEQKRQERAETVCKSIEEIFSDIIFDFTGSMDERSIFGDCVIRGNRRFFR